jgi:hypothetical protein
MVIHINPNRINVPSGNAGRAEERKRQSMQSGGGYTVPSRAHVNYIPGAESLATLISSAVEALRQGVRWDRGTILNLLV